MEAERPHPTAQSDEGDTAVTAAEAAAQAAEAEAAAAEAEARAAAARARAIRSRLSAESAADTPSATPTPLVASPPAMSNRRLAGWIAAVVALILIVAFGTASGYMLWQSRATQRDRTLTAEFNAAARQGVVNLMTVDAADADANVKRLLDSSTGKFKDDLQSAADPLTKTLASSKVTTTVSVDSTAVESMSANDGVVLVAASTEAQDPSSKDPRPARWRISVTLTREGGQLKMSQVDFVAQ
jgi:Mce-associated membrane protein